MKKAQASMETMIGFGFMIMIFIGILAFLNNFISDENQSIYEPNYYADSFKQQIELMRQSDNDVISIFNFPEELSDGDYELSLINDTDYSIIQIDIGSKNITRDLPLIINTTPFGDKGNYTITKNKTGLYIRK